MILLSPFQLRLLCDSVILITWLCPCREWTQKSANTSPCQWILCLRLLTWLDLPCFYHEQLSHLSLSSTGLLWWHWGFNALYMGWVRLAFEGLWRLLKALKPGKLVWRWGRTKYIFLTNEDNEDLPCWAVFWTSNHTGLVSYVIREELFSLLRCCYAHTHALLEQKLLCLGFFSSQVLVLLTAWGWHTGARVNWLSLACHTHSALSCSFPLSYPLTYSALLLTGAKQQGWSSCEINLRSVCSPARLHAYNLAI